MGIHTTGTYDGWPTCTITFRGWGDSTGEGVPTTGTAKTVQGWTSTGVEVETRTNEVPHITVVGIEWAGRCGCVVYCGLGNAMSDAFIPPRDLQ